MAQELGIGYFCARARLGMATPRRNNKQNRARLLATPQCSLASKAIRGFQKINWRLEVRLIDHMTMIIMRR